jgi:hypothetical protein
VKPTDRNLHHAAHRIVEAFVEARLVASKQAPADVENKVFDALRGNFLKEAAIEREAERILEANRRQTAGMDQRTLLLKIKERLARERGFVL